MYISFLRMLPSILAFAFSITEVRATPSGYSFPHALLRRTTTFTLQDTYVGSSFLSDFTFYTSDDAADGYVDYQSQSEAESAGLVSYTAETFTMRADYSATVASSASGRKSVRIKSNNAYEAHLAVFDIAHMPQGCGTWPAMWETNDDPAVWPDDGEVDIIEGVNDAGSNQVTLHTTSGCTMSTTREETGSTLSTDCNWEVNGDEGCTVSSNTANSYGPSFNTNGGGWYVLERTDDAISVWFWERSDTSVPSVVSAGGTSISSASFGTPLAIFPDTSCDLATHFGENNIIFDIDFCGAWAAGDFTSDGCSGTCEDYVANNPTAFANAFWLINAVRVYV